MKSHLSKFQLALLTVVCAACGLFASNAPNSNSGLLASDSWPQLRGSQHGHATPDAKLASEWSERKNVTWKTNIPGLGWSSPVVSDGEIWLTSSIDKPKSLRAICIDQSTGDIRQNIEVFKPKKWLEKHQRNSHATPTPILDADKVFVHFGSYGTAAIERKTGNIVWKNDELVIDHQWGPGSSPVLHKNLLICNCDGRDVRYVIALDKSTGKTVWKTDRSVPITKGPFFRKSFSTPSIATIEGKSVLLSAGANQFSAINPLDGTEQWNHEYFGYAGVAVPVIGSGMVFVASGYGDISLTALQLGDNGKQKSGQVAWTAKRNVPIIPTPIVVDTELYMVSDDGIFSCLDCKSGKVHWRKRLKGGFASSITFGDNKLFVSNDKGATTVVEPSKKKCTILATNQLDGNIQATPAIADNSLFIRTQHSLYRISNSDDG